MSTAIQDEREALAGLRISADKIKEQNAQLETIETPLCPICEQPLTDQHRARSDGTQRSTTGRTARSVQPTAEADQSKRPSNSKRRSNACAALDES